MVASLILGGIEYLILFWINPKKYELTWIVFIVNFIGFIIRILLTALIGYLVNDDYEFDATSEVKFAVKLVITMTMPIFLLGAIIGYFTVRYLRNKGIIKRRKLLWSVMLSNYITYLIMYIILSIPHY